MSIIWAFKQPIFFIIIRFSLHVWVFIIKTFPRLLDIFSLSLSFILTFFYYPNPPPTPNMITIKTQFSIFVNDLSLSLYTFDVIIYPIQKYFILYILMEYSFLKMITQYIVLTHRENKIKTTIEIYCRIVDCHAVIS